ncbi:MAG: hypothetical protein QW733_03030 [Desulfurococcaceae archaeon]
MKRYSEKKKEDAYLYARRVFYALYVDSRYTAKIPNLLRSYADKNMLI